MLYDNKNDMEESGFEGFETINLLISSKCSHVPRVKGVYFVINQDKSTDFVKESIGGHFKGRNPSLSINKLKENWVNDALVVYIGKAGGKKSKATLQSRLKQYMRFGEGYPVGHWGGRLIWQLANPKDLIICYKTLENIEPREEEKTLIKDFESHYGKLPFANLSH